MPDPKSKSPSNACDKRENPEDETHQAFRHNRDSAIRRDLINEKEHLYEEAIAASNSVAYHIDFATMSYVHMDERISDLIGYSVSEVNPDLWKDICKESIMRGETAGMQEAAANKLLHSGKLTTWRADYRCRAKNGKIKWLSDTSVPVTDSNGNVCGCLGFLQEITSRKRDEEALRLTQFTVDQAPDAIYWVSSDARFTYVNKSACSMLGYTREELLSMQVFDIDPEYSEENWKKLWAEIHDKQNLYLESTHRREDGSLFPVEIMVNYIEFEGSAYGSAHVRDISDRKKAVDNIQASEERHKAILSSILYPMITITGDGIINDVSESVEKEFGWKPEELIGHNVKIIMPDPYNSEHDNYLKQYAQTGKQGIIGQTRELVAKRKDGTVFPCELTVWKVDQLGETKPFFTGIIRNISSSKKAEAALRESERRLAAAQRIAHLGHWDWDITANNLVWSDEVYRIFGLAPQQFGATYEAFLNSVHPLDRKSVVQSVDNTLSKNDTYGIDHRIIRPDGEIRTVYTQAELYRNNEGQPVRMLGTVQDVTEQKKADLAVRESEERFRQLADNIDEVFWLTDWKEMTVLYVSDSYKKIYQQSCESIYKEPRSWSNKVHHDDRDRVVSSFLNDAPVGKYDIEYKIVLNDGSIRWIHDRAFPIHDDEGDVYRVAGISEDITDRKLAEERQKLLMRELDHRVRNNLASILSLTQLTASSSKSLKEFVDVFTGRIFAMSRTHQALSRKQWKGAEITEIINLTLEPFITKSATRIKIDSDYFRIPAFAVQPIALSLNELATNATKHGALTNNEGSISIRWRKSDFNEIMLTWIERDGPTVVKPQRMGLGIQLMEGLIQHELGGKLEIQFKPEGLSCTITIPIAQNR